MRRRMVKKRARTTSMKTVKVTSGKRTKANLKMKAQTTRGLRSVKSTEQIQGTDKMLLLKVKESRQSDGALSSLCHRAHTIPAGEL